MALGAGVLVGLTIHGAIPRPFALALLVPLVGGFLFLRNAALGMSLQAVAYVVFAWRLWADSVGTRWVPLVVAGTIAPTRWRLPISSARRRGRTPASLTYARSDSTRSISVEMSMAASIDRATGHFLGWNSMHRSIFSRISSSRRSTISRYLTWMRRMTRTLSSVVSISPVTSATSRPSCAGISRASSAPPRVPVSQPPAAATM